MKQPIKGVLVKKYRFVDGVLVNSFLEMERGPIKALTDEGSENPLVYPVGPIIQTVTSSGDDANMLECLSWLDEQQPCSVFLNDNILVISCYKR